MQKDTRQSLEHLKSVISEMAAEDGTLPPEREMVDDLGIPRSRLRKVLADMREEGLLPPAQIGRRNSRESGPQIENLARLANPTDVIEMRLVIEPQFARLAALKASSMEIARITRAAHSDPDDDYGTADLAFHLEIASSTRNSLGRELYRILRKVGSDARVRLPSRNPICPKRRKQRDAEHLRIASAISDRDPDRAEEAMRAHLAAVLGLISDRLSPDLPDAVANLSAGE